MGSNGPRLKGRQWIAAPWETTDWRPMGDHGLGPNGRQRLRRLIGKKRIGGHVGPMAHIGLEAQWEPRHWGPMGDNGKARTGRQQIEGPADCIPMGDNGVVPNERRWKGTRREIRNWRPMGDNGWGPDGRQRIEGPMGDTGPEPTG